MTIYVFVPPTYKKSPPLVLPETKSFLIFHLGLKPFALELASIYSITEEKPIHSFPMIQNSAIRGVANIDGQLKTILSLHHLLGLEQKKKDKWVLVGNPVDFFGFEVDEIIGIQTIDSIDPLPEKRNFLKGVINNKKELIGILDEDRLNLFSI